MHNVMQTKLFRPSPASGYTHRPRLIERLNKGLDEDKHMTLVSAPAGFGKTGCVIVWLAQVQRPVAWLSLEPADDDPLRFFTYLIASLHQVDENIGWDIAGVLNSGELPDSNALSSTLVNDILRVEQPFIVAIDDFQIVHEPLVLEVFERLLSFPPSGLHLVLITREDPALPLVRLRAQNQLMEIRAADLRFTQDEITTYYAQHLPDTLSNNQLQQLEARTEGWIVGLQLAGLAIQSRNRAAVNDSIVAMEAGNRHISGYLATEVISQQSEHLQRFLLYTSILERLHPDLCDAVMKHNESALLLEQLLNMNLFLSPLDNQHRWYRYHMLFADALRTLLHIRHAGEVPLLHTRASQWYADHGDIDAAMHHALLTTNRDIVIGLFETHAMHMVMDWNARTVKQWLAAIPETWRLESPRVMLVAAWFHAFKQNYAEVMHLIDRLAAFKLDNLNDDLERQILHAMALNAQRKASQSLALIDAVLNQLPADSSILNAMAYMARGDALQQLQRYPEAIIAYENIITHSHAAGNLSMELLGASVLALMAMNHGQLHYAYDIASNAANHIERSGVLPPICMGIYGELGQIHYSWNQIDSALDYFRRAIQVSELSGYSDAVLYDAIIRSRLAMRKGDQATADAEINRALNMMRETAPAVVQEQVRAQQVRVWLAGERVVEAQQVLVREGFEFSNFGDTPDATGLSEWILVNSWLRCVLAVSKLEETPDRLRSVLAMVENMLSLPAVRNYVPVTIEMLLVRAQLHAALNQTEDCYAAIENAISIARHEGFISLFIDEGVAIATMLNKMRESGGFQHQTDIDTMAALCSYPTHIVDSAPLVEPLSMREQEVLRLMSDGHKYQEIADILFISLNTVRFHVKAIYSKLSVNNRTRAIVLARELNLL